MANKRSSTPTEPSPESLEKFSKAEKEANEELQKALAKLSEGKEAAAATAHKIEKELVRRRSVPQMGAVRPPLSLPATKPLPPPPPRPHPKKP